MNAPLTYMPAGDAESLRQMQRSRLASLSIAILIHALLITLLAYVVMTTPMREAEPIVVMSHAKSTPPATPPIHTFPTGARKPQSPSMNSAALLRATEIAPLNIEIGVDLESPMIGLPGTGIGPGMGAGFLDGPGEGKMIFDPVPPGRHRVVLAIDVSTSMRRVFGDGGIAAIRKEIARTINALPPGTAFNIITYGNLADGYARKLVPAESRHKKDAVAFMDWYYQSDQFRTRSSQFNVRGRDADGTSYEPVLPDGFRALRGTTGGSRLDLALVAAFEQKADLVYLITDGAPGTRKDGQPVTREALIDIVKDSAERQYRKGPKPVVNCVGVNGVAEDYLREIAKTFGGEYKNITPDSLY